MKKRLADLMAQRRLTLTALASRAQLCPATVRRALRGRAVRAHSWQALADGLGVPHEALCGQTTLGHDLLDEPTRELLSNYELLSEERRELVRRLVKELAS